MIIALALLTLLALWALFVTAPAYALARLCARAVVRFLLDERT